MMPHLSICPSKVHRSSSPIRIPRWRPKYPTLAAHKAALEQQLERTIDLDVVPRRQLYLDLGQEVFGTDWRFPNSQLPDEACPLTLLWKTCCLEKFASNWARLSSKSAMQKSSYTEAFLPAAGDLTLESSRTSPQRQQGQVYMQGYNSIKNLFSVAKTSPFGSRWLDKITWDPEVFATIEKQGRARTTTQERLWESYLGSTRSG